MYIHVGPMAPKRIGTFLGAAMPAVKVAGTCAVLGAGAPGGASMRASKVAVKVAGTCAVLCLALLGGAAAPARGQEATVTAPATEGAVPAPTTAVAPPVDPRAARREALFDIALAALAHGDLEVSQRAFREAAGVPGDPVRSAVARSFAERVGRLHARRMQAQPFLPDQGVRRVPQPRPAERSQSTALVGTTSLLGVGLYGWTVPMALGMRNTSARRLLSTYMLVSAGAFLGPYFLTRDRHVSEGQANLALYGGTRGIFHGVLAGALIMGNLSIDQRERAWATSLLLGSTLELAGGYWLAGRTRMTAGQAHTVAALGDLGLITGVGAGYFFQFPGRASADQQAKGMAASALAGSAAGLAGGYLLGRRRDHSWGDAEVLRMAGLVGTFLGFGIADALGLQVDLQDRRVSGLSLAGTALGILVGDRLTRTTNFTVSQSMLIDLASVAGSLGATGVAYLFSPQSGEDAVPYMTAAAVGAGAGFGLTYWGLRDVRRGSSGRNAAARAAVGIGLLPTVGRRGEAGLALVGSL
jgi:hypothetical protein